MEKRLVKIGEAAALLGVAVSTLRKQMKRLVITHKDRLLRFGSELVFALCANQQIEIVIIHKDGIYRVAPITTY